MKVKQGTFRLQYFKKNKYRAVRGKCLSGHSHPSHLERDYCDQLALLKKVGEIKDYEYAKSYELRVKGKLIGKHRPDFTVTTSDGKIEVHETKGMVTVDWILRKNLFEALYPNIPYIVIK